MNSVYRLAPQAAWEAAVASGQPYEGGQLDTDSGFIHLSTHAQAGETAAMFFKGAADTMLLTVDVGKLPPDTLKWEPVAHRDDGDLLPHLYSSLPLDSVTEAVLLQLNEAGEPQLPPPTEAAPPVDAGVGEGRPTSRWRLDGMRVIVTGSTKGIGKAVASELLGLGASVLVHSRSAADVQQQVDEWRAVHGPERVHGFAADVSSPGGRQLLIAYTANLWGGKLVSWTNACLPRSRAIQLSQTGPAALRRRR
jgi:uncharacterized protein (DUF952 family)